MTFNSFEFFVFFIIVICLYYSLPHRWQNRMLLVASYFFYGWWDWRFLSLIFISTATDYFCGIQIYKQPTKEGKKKFLYLSVITNLTLLGFFKYWDFFVVSFASLLSQFGIHPSVPILHIILPVGISFYTFQTMTYSIDIYRGEIKPTHNFLDFALFVAFFPQLVAGPIERAKNLIPQIQHKRQFCKGQFLGGLHLIFWGLFKKVFVADNLGIIVDQVYGNPEATGIEYVIATWAFAFQIYGDFSGYTDIARGTAKCLGLELMHNFRQPYFAVSPADLWRRWHISLSSWLRDYLYISLGGSRKGALKTYRNIMLTITLCGLWHGAGWNFVLWGVYHGILLIVHGLYRSLKSQSTPSGSNLGMHLLKAFIMFQLFCLGLMIFRAQSLDHMKLIFVNIINSFWWTSFCADMLRKILFFATLPMLVMGFENIREIRPSSFMKNALCKYLPLANQPIFVRSIVYGILAYLLCLYGAETETFFYFQF